MGMMTGRAAHACRGILQTTAAIAATLANPAMSGLFVMMVPSMTARTICRGARLTPRLPGAKGNERTIRLP
jgi:hypothetical protein